MHVDEDVGHAAHISYFIFLCSWTFVPPRSSDLVFDNNVILKTCVCIPFIRHIIGTCQITIRSACHVKKTEIVFRVMLYFWLFFPCLRAWDGTWHPWLWLYQATDLTWPRELCSEVVNEAYILYYCVVWTRFWKLAIYSIRPVVLNFSFNLIYLYSSFKSA